PAPAIGLGVDPGESTHSSNRVAAVGSPFDDPPGELGLGNHNRSPVEPRRGAAQALVDLVAERLAPAVAEGVGGALRDPAARAAEVSLEAALVPQWAVRHDHTGGCLDR